VNRRLKIDEGYGMPPSEPYYPPLPTYYRDVRFQVIYFKAGEKKVRQLIPEPMEPSPRGLCVAFSIDVPFSTSYGAFLETGVQEQVVFKGQMGFYCSHVFLNNVPAIVSGRERWGTPKMFADIRVEKCDNLLVSTTVKDNVTVMTLTSRAEKTVTEKEMVSLFPSYRLKIIPKADGPGPAIKQIVTAAPRDAVIQGMFKGSGTVALGSSVNTALSMLEPLRVLEAFHYVASYTESYGEIVYDYLKES